MIYYKVVIKRPEEFWTEKKINALELGEFLQKVLCEKNVTVEIKYLGEYEEAKETKMD